MAQIWNLNSIHILRYCLFCWNFYDLPKNCVCNAVRFAKKSESQATVTDVSVGIAFATFVGVLVYHTYQQVWSKLQQRIHLLTLTQIEKWKWWSLTFILDHKSKSQVNFAPSTLELSPKNRIWVGVVWWSMIANNQLGWTSTSLLYFNVMLTLVLLTKPLTSQYMTVCSVIAWEEKGLDHLACTNWNVMTFMRIHKVKIYDSMVSDWTWSFMRAMSGLTTTINNVEIWCSLSLSKVHGRTE